MIQQELNPETCKLNVKHIKQRCILRIMEVLLNDHHVQNRHHIEKNKIEMLKTIVAVIGDVVSAR